MTTTMERSEFLSLGMRGGIALVAGGAVLGAAAGPALGQASGDVAIAKLAATAELLAVDVYGRAIKTGFFKDAASIAKTGVALETAFVGAYLGAVEALKDNDLKGVAALVGANEAQHLTTFKRLAAGNALVPNPSFPKSLTAKQATAAVTPFLA